MSGRDVRALDKTAGLSLSRRIPYVLDRMDCEYQDQYQEIKLKLVPSEYWRRQCRAAFQFARIGTKLVDDMAAETGGSDYPIPTAIGLRLMQPIETLLTEPPRSSVTFAPVGVAAVGPLQAAFDEPVFSDA
jgi:hypothetical protein